MACHRYNITIAIQLTSTTVLQLIEGHRCFFNGSFQAISAILLHVRDHYRNVVAAMWSLWQSCGRYQVIIAILWQLSGLHCDKHMVISMIIFYYFAISVQIRCHQWCHLKVIIMALWSATITYCGLHLFLIRHYTSA